MRFFGSFDEARHSALYKEKGTNKSTAITSNSKH